VDLTSPFARLAMTHALSMAGDALLAMSLAGSLFFKVDPAAGREKVLLGLLLTMAPFAVVGPLIGPLMDRFRGGLRAVIIVTAVLRAVVAATMVWASARGSFLLFPEAFVMLVLGKTYQVAKAAVVPTVVRTDAELVEANSKLQVIGGLSGFLAAIPGGVLFVLGPAWVVAGCSLTMIACTFAALRLPRIRSTATEATEVVEGDELNTAPVVLAATSMAVIRGIVGFVTLLLAFELRGGAQMSSAELLARNVSRNLGELMLRLEVTPIDRPPKWFFGVVVPLSVLGGLVGASIAPRLRRMLPEERILAGALLLCGLAGVAGVVLNGLAAYAILAFVVAAAASGGKQAFDAIIQRVAPDADRGRSFARFESRFQVAWVIGAVIPAAINLPFDVGAVMVIIAAVAAGFGYVTKGFPTGLLRPKAGQLSRSGKSGISGMSSSSGSD
jgi:hypothetical protein